MDNFERSVQHRACPQCDSDKYNAVVLDDSGHFPNIYYKVCNSCGYERATGKRVPKGKQPPLLQNREDK